MTYCPSRVRRVANVTLLGGVKLEAVNCASTARLPAGRRANAHGDTRKKLAVSAKNLAELPSRAQERLF
jgi:hypothetical protein